MKSENQVFEYNKETLKDANKWLDLDQNKGEVNVNITFSSYSDIAFKIESLLHCITIADHELLSKEPLMIQQTAVLGMKLLNHLPIEYMDKLFIKQNFNENQFTNLKDLK